VKEEQTAFLKSVARPALDIWRAFKVPFAIILAQAILESSWGRSILVAKAHNYFGIKYAHRQNSEDYGHFDASTWEVIDGKKEAMQAEFQMFPSVRECFTGHALLLLRSGCVVRAIPKGWQAVAVALGPWTEADKELLRKGQSPEHANYSTNPAYAGLLGELIAEYHLDDQQYIESLATEPDEWGQERA